MYLLCWLIIIISYTYKCWYNLSRLRISRHPCWKVSVDVEVLQTIFGSWRENSLVVCYSMAGFMPNSSISMHGDAQAIPLRQERRGLFLICMPIFVTWMYVLSANNVTIFNEISDFLCGSWFQIPWRQAIQHYIPLFCIPYLTIVA